MCLYSKSINSFPPVVCELGFKLHCVLVGSLTALKCSSYKAPSYTAAPSFYCVLSSVPLSTLRFSYKSPSIISQSHLHFVSSDKLSPPLLSIVFCAFRIKAHPSSHKALSPSLSGISTNPSTLVRATRILALSAAAHFLSIVCASFVFVLCLCTAPHSDLRAHQRCVSWVYID